MIEIATIRKRRHLCNIASELGYSIGAEIGVFDGGFADEMTKKWSGKWILVDPWRHFDEGFIDDCNLSSEDNESLYQSVLKRLEGRNVSVIRKDSVLAALDVKDESLDFIHIDANHSYDAVTSDIEAWWSKVVPGGIVSGHDYLDTDEQRGKKYDCHVKSAVADFVKKHQLQTPHITSERSCPTWILVKPRTIDDIASGWVNFARPIPKV
jgi:hypothetical protein